MARKREAVGQSLAKCCFLEEMMDSPIVKEPETAQKRRNRVD